MKCSQCGHQYEMVSEKKNKKIKCPVGGEEYDDNKKNKGKKKS